MALAFQHVRTLMVSIKMTYQIATGPANPSEEGSISIPGYVPWYRAIDTILQLVTSMHSYGQCLAFLTFDSWTCASQVLCHCGEPRSGSKGSQVFSHRAVCCQGPSLLLLSSTARDLETVVAEDSGFIFINLAIVFVLIPEPFIRVMFRMG